MHFRTHVKKERRGISGQDEYSDGSSHNGGTIAAHYFPKGQATPGIPADGHNKFLASFESGRGGNPSPGPLDIYACAGVRDRRRNGDWRLDKD